MGYPPSPLEDLGEAIDWVEEHLLSRDARRHGFPYVRARDALALRTILSAARKSVAVRGPSAAGFSAGAVDQHGELELKLSVDGREGSCWLSREMWLALGEKAGWSTAPATVGGGRRP